MWHPASLLLNWQDNAVYGTNQMLFESSVLTLLFLYSWSSCKLNSKFLKDLGPAVVKFVVFAIIVKMPW